MWRSEYPNAVRWYVLLTATLDRADCLGRAIAGLAVGMLTMVVPLYISEVCLDSSRLCSCCANRVQVSIPEIRGGLVVVQQC